jgi:hypothetical protein
MKVTKKVEPKKINKKTTVPKVVKKYATGGITKKDPCPPGYVWNGTECVKVEKNIFQQLRKYPKDGGTVPPPSVFTPLTKKETLKKVKKDGRIAVKKERTEKKYLKNQERYEKKLTKAKENARLNLEWERMSETEKLEQIRKERSRF